MDIAIEKNGNDYDQLYKHGEPAPTRPRTRADCIDGPRPCPWVSCKYHLLLDVKSNGGLTFNVRRPGEHGVKTVGRRRMRGAEADALAERALERLCEMPTSCALDVADEGGATYERIGELLGLRKQSVRLIQIGAKAKCKSTP
jgi:hypothetical protein